jgi:hypothetical protein
MTAKANPVFKEANVSMVAPMCINANARKDGVVKIAQKIS